MASILMKQAIGELIKGKRTLIDIPSTHSVGQALDVFLRFDILSAPVWAPPGSFIGAGGSKIIEEHGGRATKQYIGMVSVLDILIHFGERTTSKERLLQSSVVHLIGHSNETLSLWTMAPETKIYDAMEPLSKGVHRMLIPSEDHASHYPGAEIADKSSRFRLLTQTDVVRFLSEHVAEFGVLPKQTVEAAGFARGSVLSVPSDLSVLHTLQVMRKKGGVQAVALVDPETVGKQGSGDHIQARGLWGFVPIPGALDAGMRGGGGRVVGTFSASDLRKCDAHMLHSFHSMTVWQLLKRVSPTGQPKAPLLCSPVSTIHSIMETALANRVHRLWITDDGGRLSGVVTFSDIIRTFRKCSPPQYEAA